MDDDDTIYIVVGDLKRHDALRQPAAKLEVSLNPWLVRVAPSLWCVSGVVLIQVSLAYAVMCLGRAVSENSQLTMEPERADVGSVLKLHTLGTERLVFNRQRKLAGLVQASPHYKAILTHKCFRFETNVLDVYVLSHSGLFVTNVRNFLLDRRHSYSRNWSTLI